MYNGEIEFMSEAPAYFEEILLHSTDAGRKF